MTLFGSGDHSSIDSENLAADRIFDLVVTGVGAASPRAAAVLAEAIGLPLEAVVDAIYRAPGRLLAGLGEAEGARLLDMLAPLGLDLRLLPPAQVPARAPLVDVALDLLQPDAAEAVAEALARFAGMTVKDALDLILTPPGVVLGQVTAPTVAALAAALPEEAARLEAIAPERAHYALFAAGLSPMQAQQVRAALPDGAGMGADGSALLLGLTRAEADRLWRRLCAPEQVRVVPETRLRFTLVLREAQAGAAAALERLAGVPAALFPELRAAVPVPLEQDVPLAGLEARLADYAAAGLEVTAELESFAPVVLEVLSAAPDVLRTLGLNGPAPCLTPPMPRPRARVLRHRLEAAGAEVQEVMA